MLEFLRKNLLVVPVGATEPGCHWDGDSGVVVAADRRETTFRSATPKMAGWQTAESFVAQLFS